VLECAPHQQQCVSSTPKILLANLSFNLTHQIQGGKLLDYSA
jgi:hypothetical protein